MDGARDAGPRDLVGRRAVAQAISYRAGVANGFPRRGRPIGLVVGRRIGNEASGILEEDERLRFIALSDLGLTALTSIDRS